jgi:hypothetical protein
VTAQVTMPGLVFGLLLVGLALYCAAKGYASGGSNGASAKPTVHQGRTITLLGLLALPAALSCHLPSAAAPVPVAGTQEDVVALSGEWEGRFWSKATGRHGTIRFSLPERADTGFGEVAITFSPSLRLTQSGAKRDELDPKPCTAIDIRLVRVEGGRVRGTMATYWDPDRDCRASTVFEGSILGDRITGTFRTERAPSDQRVVSGKWRVDRGRS